MTTTDTFKLEAREREETGKGAARKLRREGNVPAVVYGHGFEPIHIYVNEKEMKHLLQTEAKLVELSIEGRKKPVSVIIKEVEADPIRDNLLHVDFQKIRLDETVTTTVPVVLVGEEECVGVRMGGIIQHGLREIEIECLPKNLPSHIEVDIRNLEIGDGIKVADLELPEGVKTTAAPEEQVVVVVPPAVLEEEVEAVKEEEAAEVPTVAETEKEEESEEG